jgi:hypothetical protein
MSLNRKLPTKTFTRNASSPSAFVRQDLFSMEKEFAKKMFRQQVMFDAVLLNSL